MNVTRRGLLGGVGGALATSAVGAQPFGLHRPPGKRKLEPQEVKPHMDVHVHLIGGREQTFGDAAARCLAEMQKFRITKAVVMSPPQAPPGIFDYLNFVPELQRHGGKFAFLGGGGVLNPMLHNYREPDSVTPKVKQEFRSAASRILDAGAAGFGEIAVLHLSLVPRHPFEQVASTHPLLAILFEIADRRATVIDLHMDPVVAESMRTPSTLKVPPNPPTLTGNVRGLEQLLSAYPAARIVWAHGGSDFTGNFTPDLIRRMMDEHPNLYMSLRPIPPQATISNPFGLRFYNLILTPTGIAPDWLALLQKHSDRFVIGSDAFFVSSSVNPEGPASALSRGTDGRLMAAAAVLSGLPSNLSAQIATVNSARIYRI